MTSSYAAAALLGSEITGSDTRGAIAAVGLSIGGTLAGLPLAAVMARNGRRIGIGGAYLVGAIGAASAAIAAIAATWSGVDPQQPPITFSQPSLANESRTAAMFSGVSSYSPNSFGRPAFG